jgi:ribosomal protein S18 acetylase RimI-like enzyme
MPLLVVPFSKDYSYKTFDCGNENLNSYLKLYALKNDKLGFGKTYLAIDDNENVAGYFTLSNANVDHNAMPQDGEKKIPRYPVPGILLSRLAVDKSKQGQGIGEQLLVSAFKKVMEAAEISGVFALFVDAIDDKAQGFYLKNGFKELNASKYSLFLTLRKIREAFAAK